MRYCVESLEGGDFKCGDVATFLTQIKVDNLQNLTTPRKIQLVYAFTLDTTGQTGLALGPVTLAKINYGAVSNGAGPGGTDSGNVDDGGSTAILVNQTAPAVTVPPYFTAGEDNLVTITVDDLEKGEQVILRIDAKIACKFGFSPTGNLQASIKEASVINPTPAEAIPVGNQTVPFKSSEDVIFPGKIIVDKVTDPAGSTQLFNFQISAPGSSLSAAYNKTFSLTDTSTPYDTGYIDPSYTKIGNTNTLVAGTYTVAELNIPQDWQLGSLTCVNDSGVSQGTSAGTSLSFNLDENEIVTCTFNNTLPAAALTVSKTANTSLTRTYSWKIDKQADGEYWKSIGDLATAHNYTVAVDKTTTDSGWAVSGDITIKNNSPRAATIQSVADVVSGGITATVACPVTFPYTLAVGETLTCPYSAGLPNANDRTNTATVTTSGNVQGGTATVDVKFSGAQIKEVGPASINVTDSNGKSWGPVSDDTSWNYSQDFTCPTDLSQYTNGVYNAPDAVNTAKITETNASDTATVKLHCYAPVVSKSANATYTRQYDWTITKGQDGTYTRFAGESVTHGYTVAVDQTITEKNFVVAGTITVENPNPKAAMSVAVADSVNGAPATLDCGGTLNVPAGGSATCDYTANLTAKADGTNTATVTFNALTFTGSKDYVFSPTDVGQPTINVSDTNGKSWSANSDNSWNYNETFTCSSDPKAYLNGTYDIVRNNVASIDGTNLSDSAAVTVTCYAPVVSKTAAGSYNEVHSWDVSKSVSPESQRAFAGDTVSYTWTVGATESTTNENFAVTGEITVVNPAPMVMTVTVSDKLADGTAATITNCTDGTYDSVTDKLTIPAKSTAVCSYSANPAGSGAASNNVRVTLSGVDFLVDRTVDITWTHKVIHGSVSLTDDQNPNLPSSISDGGSWTYKEEYTCSTDTSKYDAATHTYSFGENNTATLKDGVALLDSASASTGVTCYVPTISKTAAGSYDERHEWTVEKSVSPGSQDVLAGATGNFKWTVKVTEGIVEENFAVTGSIRVTNPRSDAGMTVDLADRLDDTTATVTITGCSVGTWNSTDKTVAVPASSTAVCAYEAAPSGRMATHNTATATLNGVDYTASADVGWTATVIRASASLADDQNPNLPKTITEGGTWTYNDSHTCSTEQSDYNSSGTYLHVENNTVTVSSGDKSDSAGATTGVTCHAPVVTKDASTYWTRDWIWSIVKTADGTYNLLAGDTATHGYKVTVDPTSTDNFWGVKGTITVANSHPTEAMTLSSLSDLAGTITGKVTCPNDSLVIPAGGSLTCTYDTGVQNKPNANPFGNLNTATAVFAGADWTGTAPITFSSTPTTENHATITVDDNNLTDESWSADRTNGEWTYTRDFACPTDASKYTDGKYSYSLTNTAKINETGQSDTATVNVNCYMPQIDVTKTGDSLSKIGDGVTYTITAYNNTPEDAGLRDLTCTISDPLISFNKTVTLASGTKDVNSGIKFTIPSGASDPFVNTASLTCKPVAATAPVVGSATFSVSDRAQWSTNLFQPAVEIVKTGPAYATSGDKITYSFTITNKSSSDSPKLVLDTLTDDVIGDLKPLALSAGCDNLVYNGTCTFTKDYIVPDVGLQPRTMKNIVTVHYHPAGFPNDITDTDDHTVTVAPRSQLTDTSYCPLPNDQFRLLYHLETAPNIYRLQASNPGQFYYNGFYFGKPGSDFTMSLRVPYPFITQEGAGNPIQVHDGTSLTSGGCYSPNPSLSGYSIATQAMAPASSSGNQIITPEDYTTKSLGSYTTVTVSGKVPASGMAYVTIHLDYGLKRTGSWKQSGTYTTNPVGGASIADVNNGTITIHGYEVYNFSRTVGSDTATSTPASYNEFKKFAGFLGFAINKSTGNGAANAKVVIYDPTNKVLATVYTDADGYYMYAYKHTAKSATYTVKLPDYSKSVAVTVKANGIAAVDFDIP